MTNAVRDPGGCLISGYSAGAHGYAQIGWLDGGERHMVLAHRAVWVHERGEISEGYTVDHRQGVCPRKCIEITHLRLLTNYENARRNRGHDFPLGQCQHGHGDEHLREYSRGGGKRTIACSICRSDMQRRYYRKRRA